jgi:CHASE3 domain sensor protein
MQQHPQYLKQLEQRMQQHPQYLKQLEQRMPQHPQHPPRLSRLRQSNHRPITILQKCQTAYG